jgi:hypothetical protein
MGFFLLVTSILLWSLNIFDWIIALSLLFCSLFLLIGAIYSGIEYKKLYTQNKTKIEIKIMEPPPPTTPATVNAFNSPD